MCTTLTRFQMFSTTSRPSVKERCSHPSPPTFHASWDSTLLTVKSGKAHLAITEDHTLLEGLWLCKWAILVFPFSHPSHQCQCSRLLSLQQGPPVPPNPAHAFSRTSQLPLHTSSFPSYTFIKDKDIMPCPFFYTRGNIE